MFGRLMTMIKIIKSNVKREKDRIKKLRHKAMGEACLMIEADSRLLAPVKTGTLKRSITHDVKSDDTKTVGRVGSGVEYAYWASRHTPYLEPALEQNIEKIRRRIAEVMQE